MLSFFLFLVKMLRMLSSFCIKTFSVAAISEIETAMSSYKNISANSPSRPIWAVAENYRFEPAFVEVNVIWCLLGTFG